MATPTRQQNVSTPKNPLTPTLNRVNASPRPNSGALHGRPLAYKSPAVKTPASAHRTSHPMSTPLPGSTLPDELLNLSSPSAAALIMGGQTGLTPLVTGQDGLGISTGMGSAQTRDNVTTRDPQIERTRRLKDVADTLKKRATSRNVTRENVETLAQVHGFDNIWDVDTLSIAGTRAVDLEILFDGVERDRVVKSTLKLNLPDEEGKLQPDASGVLTQNLVQKDGDTGKFPWISLEPFASNLEYLDSIEHLDTTANCFYLINGLYDTFRNIWNEEKKRMKWRHDAHHESQGNVGKPVKDAEGKLGLRSMYWTDGLSLHKSDDISEDEKVKTWVAEFSCEKGSPFIPSRQRWLADEPLLNTLTAENIFHESQVDKPSWQDPTTSSQEQKGSDAMHLDQDPSSIEMLDVRFSCNLQPPILLPLYVVNNFNAQAAMITLDQSRVSTFQQGLKQDGTLPQSLQTQDLMSSNDETWTKTMNIFDKNGKHREITHDYHFYMAGAAWAYSTKSLHFCHPRQFADVLPVLRQYALVETLLRSIVSNPAHSSQSVEPTKNSVQQQRDRPIKRSNKVQTQEKLRSVLRSKSSNSLPIDVRLDVVSDVNKPKIECRIPLPHDLVGPRGRPFFSMTIGVRLNGVLEVIDMQGIEANEKESLSKKISKVIKVSEDIGVAIEWLLEELRTKKAANA